MKKPTLASEIKLTLTIFATSVIWIIYSDKLIHYFIGKDSYNALHFIEIGKGLLFVTLMSLGLFFLLKKHDKEITDYLGMHMNLFNNNPNVLFICEANTLKIIDINDAAIEKYGYSRNEFVNLTIHDITVEAYQNDIYGNYLDSDPFFSHSKTWKHKTKKGNTISMRLFSHDIFINKKKSVFVLATDISEILEKNAQMQLLAFRNSHEVRKPVANILGLISLLDKSDFNASNKELIKYIEDSATELDSIIRQIAKDASLASSN